VVREALSESELEALFDEAPYFVHVDTIFARVFGEEAKTATPAAPALAEALA
jgi:hypothetical protein